MEEINFEDYAVNPEYSDYFIKRDGEILVNFKGLILLMSQADKESRMSKVIHKFFQDILGTKLDIGKVDYYYLTGLARKQGFKDLEECIYTSAINYIDEGTSKEDIRILNYFMEQFLIHNKLR